jgi:hypothetical protein
VDRFTKITFFGRVSRTLVVKKQQISLCGKYFAISIPDNFISDCGPQFISHFSKHRCDGLRITCNLSSTHRPQTDGQKEHRNQTLEQYLRCFSNYQQDNWSHLLHLAELAYNNIVHLCTLILVTILDDVSWTSHCTHQILARSNMSIACNSFSPSCLHIFITR